MAKDNEYIPEGAIILARIIRQNKIWNSKPAWWLKVWTYILMRVNHKKNNGFKRGENFFNRRMIYEDCSLRYEHINISTVDNVIRWLRENNMITTRKTTRGMIVKVCNYNKYQDLSNYKNDTKDEIETRQKRDRNETINKNDKNDNNVKNVSKKTRKFIEKFNRLFNRDFRFTTGRRDKMKTRLKTFTFDEILKALENLSKSNWHRGENPNDWRADPEFLLRNDEQVDKWLNKKQQQTPQPHYDIDKTQ